MTDMRRKSFHRSTSVIQLPSEKTTRFYTNSLISTALTVDLIWRINSKRKKISRYDAVMMTGEERHTCLFPFVA
jgi:hypothetical protein